MTCGAKLRVVKWSSGACIGNAGDAAGAARAAGAAGDTAGAARAAETAGVARAAGAAYEAAGDTAGDTAARAAEAAEAAQAAGAAEAAEAARAVGANAEAGWRLGYGGAVASCSALNRPFFESSSSSFLNFLA